MNRNRLTDSQMYHAFVAALANAAPTKLARTVFFAVQRAERTDARRGR